MPMSLVGPPSPYAHLHMSSVRKNKHPPIYYSQVWPSMVHRIRHIHWFVAPEVFIILRTFHLVQTCPAFSLQYSNLLPLLVCMVWWAIVYCTTLRRPSLENDWFSISTSPAHGATPDAIRLHAEGHVPMHTLSAVIKFVFSGSWYML